MSKKPTKKKRNPLNPKQQTRPRREFIDYDYLKKLSKEEKDWLAKFTDEFYGGKFEFTDEYKKIPNKRKVFKQIDPEIKYSSENLHKTPEQRKDCYARNDAAKRCIYNLSNITGKLKGWETLETYLHEVSKHKNGEEILNEIVGENIKKWYSGSYEEEED